MTIRVLFESEYEAQEYDAVLIKERTVVCVDADADEVRMIPLSKVSHVDAPEESFAAGMELPGWFHGSGNYGFVDETQFPDLRQHFQEIERETA